MGTRDFVQGVRDPDWRAGLRASIAQHAESATQGRDGLANLVQVVEQLDRATGSEGPALVEELATLDTSREAARDLARLWLEAANALQRSLRARAGWIEGEVAQASLPQAVALALRAVNAFATWSRLSGAARAPWPYRALHALYHLAESEGVDRVRLADAGGRDTSPEAEYIRALLLARLDDAALAPIAFARADGWLADWSAECAMQPEAERGLRLAVRLTGDEGLKPTDGSDRDPATRWLGAQALVDHVRALRESPVEETLAAAFESLARDIDPAAGQRAEPRVRFMGQQVDVVTGFDAVVRALVASGQGMGAAPADVPALPVSRWSVHDMSSNAFGLVAEAGVAAGVEPGTLLALRRQDGRGWLVGAVVRRVPRDDGRVLCGVEGLSRHALAVLLRPEGRPTDTAAVLLAGDDSRGTRDTLLISKGDATAARPHALYLEGGPWRVRMRRRVRQGTGWETVSFAVEGR